MLGFQHMYAEVDDRQLLKQMIGLYFDRNAPYMSLEVMVGVLIWRPGTTPLARLPWTIRQQPELFPLMLIERAWVKHPDRENRPWFNFGQDPTYILHPTEGYTALDQLLHQFDHYLLIHESDWRGAWLQVPRPDCDGSIEEGFTISAGYFDGPLVIGRRWMEYHK